jgi:tryptophanyl-tRNA synthetase
MSNKKGRVFSGARPTGRQHLGNYFGAIQNYVALQKDYDCVYCIVDVHALTTLETTLDIKQNTLEMALDWLAAGIDPEDSILFVQSHVPQVTELHTYLSMVTPLGKLSELPNFKEEVKNHPKNVNYGLLGYPVLMASDILLYKTNVVPVGVDQQSHLEFTREVVRSFNYRYGTDVLIEPQMKLTDTPKIIGTDGVAKMSKSLDNHIEMAATPEETVKKVKTMKTDPQRLRLTDPGDPDVCNVFSLHKIFSDEADVNRINAECRKAEIGCVACKMKLAENINTYFAPYREKRAEFAADETKVWEILNDGADRARKIATQTMAEVRDAIGLAPYRG